MENELKVVKHLDNLQFGFWSEEDETFVPLIESNKDKIAEHLGCSEEFLDAIEMFVADIKELVGKDLKDIWNKVVEAEL